LPDPEIVLALRKIVKRERPDVVHAHNWLAYSFVPLKRWSGVPFIVSLHDYSFRCVQKRLMRSGLLCDGPGIVKCMDCAANHYGGMKGRATALSHRGMNPMLRTSVDMFLPVSHATAAGNGLIEEQLPFQVIPNFLPVDRGMVREDVSRYTSQLPPDGFLLFVGDLSRDKGVDVLLRAYAGLQNAPPLVLIGRRRPDTPTELPANVFMLGSWPHSAVMEAYRRCSFSLLPSVCAETFGIVVIEAMSMARPVIASRIGGLSDVIIDGENGFLVPPRDVESLRQSMQRLLSDAALRAEMEKGALRRAQDFGASAVVPRIETVYRKLRQPGTAVQNDNTPHFEGTQEAESNTHKEMSL
jgi:glycosyltransferase involved in cell wall biosynthesis